MKYSVKQFLIFLLSSLLGCFFIFSAFTKTQPIQHFEYTIHSQLFVPQLMAVYAARFFIGLEAALGLLLLLNIYGSRKWVIKASFWLLIVFTIHLSILYFNAGNDVNCGCMGSMVPMTPMASILKNVVLLILFGILWKSTSRPERSNWQQITSLIVVPLIIAIPFVIFPAQLKHIPVSKLYGTQAKHLPEADLRHGKHFVGFLSMTCSHCRDAARTLSAMKKSDSTLPIQLVFMDPEVDSTRTIMLTDFLEDTKATNIPYSFLEQKPFRDIAGLFVPAMYWINDSAIVKKINVPDLNQKEFQLWIKSK